MGLRHWLRLHHLGTGDAVEASVYGRTDAAESMGEAMSLDAMKQALEVLSLELPTGSHLELKNDLRAAIEQAQPELVCVCGAIWEGQELVSAPSQRKPLTHPQIHELDWPDDVSFDDILLFARAVERAHGIKENT